ncbi:hypothetical protein FPRO04_14476 [Fusarium proliferatum]|nr:hypothetical protein FPRO04_14476 [Fusarium proliferatum]
MATIAQQHLPDSPPSNTNSDTQATGRRTDGSERGEGEGRWLLYNEEYQSLICAFHGYAVRFRNLEGHLKDRHPDLSHQVRSDLIRRHKGLLPTLLEEGPREDQLARHGSSNPAEPVEGLPIHRGFACTWPGCGYLTPSWKCLRMHFNDEHNAKAAKRKTQADLWAAVHLQTFFTGPKRAIRYFCVREVGRGEGEREEGGGSERRRRRGRGATTVTQPEDQMTIAHITKGWSLQQEEQEEMQKVMDEGILRHETTNWLKRTGWSAHFTGRNLMDIQACSKMPGRGNEGNDEVLRHMNEALDRLFFDRCIGGLKSMPLMTRLLLASPHPHDAHSRPFGPLQEKTSMDRYLGYIKRFLCYCLNVLSLEEEVLLADHGFRFTLEQRANLEKLWAHLQGEEDEEIEGDDDEAEEDEIEGGRPSSSRHNSPNSDEGLQERILQVLAGFWTQRLDGDPFASPLWHFVGVLGIDGETGQLRPAHLFTYVLAGLVFTGRALLGEWAIPTRERDGMEDLTQRFAQVRDAWLCKATYSPMGYILSLLLFGKKIARETGSRLMVSWSKQGEMMYFMGKPILMEDLRTMVAKMTADAEDLLWGQLMFKEGNDERFVIPLAGIEDDLTQTRRGQSFIHRNGLAGKEVEMLADLITSSRKTDLLDQTGEWKWAGIRKYLKLVKRFEEFLLLLAHITGGQPSRGEEITGLRLINGINRDRNIFIIDGEVVLVTQYHKSLAHFDSPKVIPRFLPGRIGQLFVMYMIYIRPLTDRWEADKWELYGEKMAPPSDFIWHNEAAGGVPWESSQMSAAMGRWTSYYIGRRIMLQDWRHIAIAISKKHARDRGAGRADFEDGEDDHDESEQYEVPDDLAASHTGQTAANYGVTIDILKRLTAESLEIFGQVSHRWHKFLGCDKSSSLLSSPSGKKVEPIPRQDREVKEGHPPRKRAKVTSLEALQAGKIGVKEKEKQEKEKNEEEEEEDMIIRALRAVLRNNNARFRSPQQEEAVRQAAAQQSPLVAVLPTGGGKSLVFMVPAMLASAGVTIVVAPYAELKRQLVQRCVDAGLDCKPWPEARSSWPRITLVSAEAAITDDFLQWAADLSVNGRLDRVVIDECHLTFTAAETYRSKLRGLVLLRSLGCPFVFLTGTLPPLRQRDFEEAMQLQNPLYIRASSHRLNVRYAVLRVRNGRGVMEVKRRVEARLPDLSAGEKGIIYCTSQAKCKALARQLDCHYYHALRDDSDSQFIAQREEGFQAWLRGEAPYIVATAALGTGIDVAGIIHVIHLEAPFSIIDYAQEAGRAGRTGEPVTAEVIIEDKDWPDEDAAGEACLDISVREVRRLIRTRGCRRRLLGQCLDGDLRDCKDLGGDDEAKVTRCDNCHHDELAWKSELSAQGIIASHARGRQDAHALEVLESALEEVEELGKMGCRICWMFDGIEEARHMWGECQSTAGTKDLSFTSCMDFQGLIDYKKDRQARFLSCFYCHVSQELCRDGYKTKGASCWRWKHTVIPVALAATTEADLLLRIQEAAGREFKSRQDYGDWLGRKHTFSPNPNPEAKAKVLV